MSPILDKYPFSVLFYDSSIVYNPPFASNLHPTTIHIFSDSLSALHAIQHDSPTDNILLISFKLVLPSGACTEKAGYQCAGFPAPTRAGFRCQPALVACTGKPTFSVQTPFHWVPGHVGLNGNEPS